MKTIKKKIPKITYTGPVLTFVALQICSLRAVGAV